MRKIKREKHWQWKWLKKDCDHVGHFVSKHPNKSCPKGAGRVHNRMRNSLPTSGQLLAKNWSSSIVYKNGASCFKFKIDNFHAVILLRKNCLNERIRQK